MRTRMMLPLLLAAAAPVAAAPPPAPAPWKAVATARLTVPADPTHAADDAALFAADVVATVNGERVAAGKAAWLAWRTAHPIADRGAVLGHSDGAGDTLLVVEQVDHDDWQRLPPGVLFDPRPDTRATLYRFGDDQLIHAVEITVATGFWVRDQPRPAPVSAIRP